jgi:hypothetical protein
LFENTKIKTCSKSKQVILTKELNSHTNKVKL